MLNEISEISTKNKFHSITALLISQKQRMLIYSAIVDCSFYLIGNMPLFCFADVRVIREKKTI